MAIIKIFLLLLSYNFIACIEAGSDELILTEDKPYEVLKINIPASVWKHALDPTPVLKSAATIVVPVQVSDDEEFDEDDEILEQNEEVQDNLVTNTAILNDEPSIVEEQVVQDELVTPAPSMPNRPASDEVPQRPVTGHLIRFPCSCVDGQCGCCTGAFMERFSMKACGNITFVPEDFVFDVRMSVNNNTVVRRRVSASDPPPICFNPRRVPFVRVCAEISNIRIRNRNAFACLDINADIADFPVYSASFRCFGLGSSGVQTGLKPKPISSGPEPINLFGNGDDDEDGGFIENAAGTLLGDGDGGLIGNVAEEVLGGGEGGLFGGGSNDGGPLETIGDAVGNIFEGRKFR